jgi:hypothetical protein
LLDFESATVNGQISSASTSEFTVSGPGASIEGPGSLYGDEESFQPGNSGFPGVNFIRNNGSVGPFVVTVVNPGGRSFSKIRFNWLGGFEVRAFNAANASIGTILIDQSVNPEWQSSMQTNPETNGWFVFTGIIARVEWHYNQTAGVQFFIDQLEFSSS